MSMVAGHDHKAPTAPDGGGPPKSNATVKKRSALPASQDRGSLNIYIGDSSNGSGFGSYECNRSKSESIPSISHGITSKKERESPRELIIQGNLKERIE